MAITPGRLSPTFLKTLEAVAKDYTEAEADEHLRASALAAHVLAAEEVIAELLNTIRGSLRDIGDVLRAYDQPASKEQLEAAERDLRAVVVKATAGGAA
jgi:transposase